jgi:hypothetical protein
MEESEHKIDFDEKGNIIFKKIENIAKGKKSKSGGASFELRVRRDLEEKNWIVVKWTNNIEENKIIPAKRVFKKFNKNMGVMTIGTGFPDFLAFQLIENKKYRIIGVEVKSNGNLKKIEKEKCAWYLKNEIFEQILIAKKIKEKNKIHVEYENFSEIYPKFLI